MQLTRYLVIGYKPNAFPRRNPSARLSVQSPSLKGNEIAVALKIDVPDSLFKVPQLRASITVPEDSVSAPVIEAEVLENIKEELNQQLGVDLSIQVIENP